MQLVLSKNRVIAHGENFLAMGGVVINTETGAKYENATIADCNGCPSDINEVGYEYHAGVFVPCAPYGKGNGNGYFMEVCADCATPRSSGIPIKDINWGKVGSVACTMSKIEEETTKQFDFPISSNELLPYSMLRYRIKAGSWFEFGDLYWGEALSYPLLSVGGEAIYKLSSSLENTRIRNRLDLKKDIVIPFYLVNTTTYGFKVTNVNTMEGTTVFYKNWYSANNVKVDPLTISLRMPGGYNDITVTPYEYHYSKANVVVELEGRK